MGELARGRHRGVAEAAHLVGGRARQIEAVPHAGVADAGVDEQDRATQLDRELLVAALGELPEGAALAGHPEKGDGATALQPLTSTRRESDRGICRARHAARRVTCTRRPLGTRCGLVEHYTSGPFDQVRTCGGQMSVATLHALGPAVLCDVLRAQRTVVVWPSLPGPAAGRQNRPGLDGRWIAIAGRAGLDGEGEDRVPQQRRIGRKGTRAAQLGHDRYGGRPDLEGGAVGPADGSPSGPRSCA